MRLNLLLILFSFGFINDINSQWTIKHLDESVFTYDNIIKFKNDSFGLFMGDNSEILKTVDIGETWNVIDIESQINVKDFHFVADSLIYAVGDFGTGQNLTSKIIKSADNGDTWDSINSFNKKQLNSIWFFNNDSGMVAGYDGIYRTADSGNSWDTVWSINKFGYQYGSLEGMCFPTSHIGYAIGVGRTQNNTSDLFDYFLLKTYNSGLTWDTVRTYSYPPTAIQFLNKDTGFIGTGKNPTLILKTINGGNTWNETQIADYYGYMVKSIHFISNMTGYATGAPNAFIPEGPTSFFISKTSNGGDSWESYDTIGIPLNSIYFINDAIGFVSGSYSLIMKSNGMINELPDDYPWHIVVNIDETGFSNSHIKIYPNPTNGMIQLLNTNSTLPIKAIKILTASGRIIDIIKPISDNELVQIDLSGLSPGMYLIKVSFSGGNEILKVLKN